MWASPPTTDFIRVINYNLNYKKCPRKVSFRGVSLCASNKPDDVRHGILPGSVFATPVQEFLNILDHFVKIRRMPVGIASVGLIYIENDVQPIVVDFKSSRAG